MKEMSLSTISELKEHMHKFKKHTIGMKPTHHTSCFYQRIGTPHIINESVSID